MAKIQQIFQVEVRRLAKKEIKLSIVPLSRQLAALKKQIVMLEKAIRGSLDKASAPAPVSTESKEQAKAPAKKVNVTRGGILRLRKKLALSQAEFALAAGVSSLTVCHWEQGKTKPRDSQKQAIAALRTMGKRAVAKLLDAKKKEQVKSVAAPAAAAPVAPVETKPAK